MLKRIIALSLATFTLFTSTGCSIIGIRTTPEPSYEVLQKDGQFELRRYKSMVVASTRVSGDFESAGDKGFRPLFRYITGANQSNAQISMTAPVIAEDNVSQQIPMTAPVISKQVDKQWEYQFVLPDEFTLDNAPQPTNPQVIIKATQPKTVAVIRYSGLWRETTKNRNQEKLEAWISDQKITPIGNPMIAGYDPPWTLPFFRRNEILVEVQGY